MNLLMKSFLLSLMMNMALPVWSAGSSIATPVATVISPVINAAIVAPQVTAPAMVPMGSSQVRVPTIAMTKVLTPQVTVVTPATISQDKAPLETYTMPEITVYGEQVGISQKEISSDDIVDVHNTGNLGLALDEQSGIETQGEGMGKTWNTLAIRGQSFRETVILVNGARVPESFNLGTIPTENIKKVEVVEGPQALVYGSDAVGGVINIVTRDADKNLWNLQVSGGDFNTYQFQASTGTFDLAGIKNTISGSYFSTDGYSPIAPGVSSTGVTYFFTDEVHWDVSHVAFANIDGDKVSLSSSFFHHTGSAPDADNVIAAGTDQYDLDGRQDAWGVQSVLKDEHPMGSWILTTSANGNYSDVLRSNPIGADPTSGVYDPYRNQYFNAGGQIYASGSAGDFLPQLSIGVEGRNESLWSGLYGTVSRQVGSVAASGTIKLSDSVRLNLANRVDDYSDFNITDNPSGSLVVDAAKDWQIHFSVGKGYKVPTFDQLYLPYTAFANLSPALAAQFAASPFGSVWPGDKGNPLLQPEQSVDSELGMDIKTGDFLVQLAGFADFYQNLINPAVDPADNFWTYVNIDHALFVGTEDSVKYHLSDIFAPYVSGTYISATDDQGNNIQGRMRFKFAGGMEIKPEKQWSLDSNVRYVDRYPVATQYLTDLGAAPTASDYWSLNIQAKYTISEHLKGFLDVENVLNEKIVSFQGLAYPGRTFEGGLQASF